MGTHTGGEEDQFCGELRPVCQLQFPGLLFSEHRSGKTAEMKFQTGIFFKMLPDPFGIGGGELFAEENGTAFHQSDSMTGFQQGIGQFQTEQTTADDGYDGFCPGKCFTDRDEIGIFPQRQDAGKFNSRNRRQKAISPRGQKQSVIRNRAAVGELEFFSLSVQGGNGNAGAQFDALFTVSGCGLDEKFPFRQIPLQGTGQGGTAVGGRIFPGKDGDSGIFVIFSGGSGGFEGGDAATDDLNVDSGVRHIEKPPFGITLKIVPFY